MRYFLFLFIFTTSIQLAMSQTAQVVKDWSTYYGGEHGDIGNCITEDDSSNVYLAGVTASLNNISTPNSHLDTNTGGAHAFIAKFDAKGNRIWGTYFGGPGNDRIFDIKSDPNGGVVVCGLTNSASGIATNGAHLTQFVGGASDAFVAKFDAAGKLIWSTYYGGLDDEHFEALVLDAASNIYLLGTTESDSAIATPGAMQISMWNNLQTSFITKFSSGGQLQWSTYFGGNGEDEGEDIGIDGNGEIIVAGTTNSDSGIASNGAYQGQLAQLFSSDLFLLKLNSNGSRIWSTYYGENSQDEVVGLIVDGANNFYVSGTTYSKTNFSTSGSHQATFGGGFSDAFLCKFSSVGNLLWSTYYGGNSSDFGRQCGLANEMIVLSGNTNSLGNISSSGSMHEDFLGQTDGFVAVFDTSGTRAWSTYIGGPAHEEINDVYVSSQEIIQLTGYTFSDSNISTIGAHQEELDGDEDAYIMRLDECYSTNEIRYINSCGAYLSPSGNYRWTENGTYYDTVKSSSHCDSNLQIHLTIRYVEAVLKVTNASLYSVNLGDEYQWIDCDNGNQPIQGESRRSFRPKSKGKYALVLKEGSCTDTSACVTMDFVGIRKAGDEQLSIFPNPVADMINIQGMDAPLKFIIRSFEGQLLKDGVVSPDQNQIDVVELNSGIYLLELENGLVSRFIKL